MTRRFAVAVLGAVVLGAGGCGGGDDAGAAEGVGAGGAAGGGAEIAWPRGLQLVGAPVQADPSDRLFYAFRRFPIHEDVDVVSLHQDFYGIPWEAFADDAPLPPAWLNRMDEVAAWANDWGKPVLLSIGVLNGNRDQLFERVLEEAGQLATEDNWSDRCFDFATHSDGPRYRAAFVRYAEWIVDRLDPAYVVLGVEINIFASRCDESDPGAYDALIDVVNEARRAVKATRPDVPVAPSIQLERLYDVREGGECYGSDGSICLQRNLARSSTLESDFLAVSSYPDPGENGRQLATLFETVRPDHVVIAETGLNSRPLTLDLSDGTGPSQCTTLLELSDAHQREYFQSLLSLAQNWPIRLLTWWSIRDLLPADVYDSCPCQSMSSGFCETVDHFRSLFDPPHQGEFLYKAFGAMGTRTYDGTPKPILSDWNAARGN